MSKLIYVPVGIFYACPKFEYLYRVTSWVQSSAFFVIINKARVNRRKNMIEMKCLPIYARFGEFIVSFFFSL